jgi:hypothetical protein
MDEQRSRAATWGGVAIIAAAVTGVWALFLAGRSATAGQFDGAGLSLIAAALAFTGIAHAIFRR